MKFKDLFLQHIGRSWDKQKALGDLIKGSGRWDYDQRTATLKFSNSYTFKIQMVGTESTISNTWLWTWANTGSPTPLAMMHASLVARDFGEKNDVAELVTPKLLLSNEVNGGTLLMVVCGIYGGDSFYRGPYDNGAMFMLIKDPKYPQLEHHPIHRVVEIFPQLLGYVPIKEQRTALYYYLQSYDLSPQADGEALVAHHSDGLSLRATFDHRERLINLKVE
jgi:hypothetical protein